MEHESELTYEMQAKGICIDTKGCCYIRLIGIDENAQENEFRVYIENQQVGMPSKFYVKVKQNATFGGVRIAQNEPLPLSKNELSEEISHWLVWDQEGNWKQCSEVPTEQSAFHIAIPVNKPDLRLVFCYPSGRINVVKEMDFRKNSIEKKGWSNAEKPMCILTAEASDYLVILSAFVDQSEYVKVHPIYDIPCTQSALCKGNRFLPEVGYRPMSYYVIPDNNHRKHILHLIMYKELRQTTYGEPLIGSVYQEEVDYLLQVITQTKPM